MFDRYKLGRYVFLYEGAIRTDAGTANSLQITCNIEEDPARPAGMLAVGAQCAPLSKNKYFTAKGPVLNSGSALLNRAETNAGDPDGLCVDRESKSDPEQCVKPVRGACYTQSIDDREERHTRQRIMQEQAVKTITNEIKMMDGIRN